MSTNLNSNYRIRRAGVNELDTVLHHRRSMFLDMGFEGNTVEEAKAISETMFADAMKQDRYAGWFVKDINGAVVAGGGIVLIEFQPGPRDPSTYRPWVVNMYTERGHRGKGLARELMKIMTVWSRQQGFRNLYLHSSKEGRPIYESLGFTPTNEMGLGLGSS